MFKGLHFGKGLITAFEIWGHSPHGEKGNSIVQVTSESLASEKAFQMERRKETRFNMLSQKF